MCCFFTTIKQPKPKSGAINRGHHSTTPKICQPRFINQNNNGGLWLYASPFRDGTIQSASNHIDHATAR